MMINVVKIDWNDINKAVPAFLTISIMPLTYSISYGAHLSLHASCHAKPCLACAHVCRCLHMLIPCRSSPALSATYVHVEC